MTVSTTITNIPSDTWVQLHSGAGDCTVQLISNGPIYVYAGVTAPPATTVKGIILKVDKEQSVGYAGLVAGDFVWARCDTTAFGQDVSVVAIV